jgi:hypothetical protein
MADELCTSRPYIVLDRDLTAATAATRSRALADLRDA